MATIAYQTITAKYKSECSACGKLILPGERIKYAKGEPTLHAACELPEIPADAIHLSGGGSGWMPGQVIRNRDHRIGRGEPTYLKVLTASRRYIPEDGLSFGLGDESGYLYSAACRAATDEESAPLREKEAKAEARRQAGLRRNALRQRIREQGEAPDGLNVAEGRRVLDTQTIYGGGDWFVLGEEHIWYVLNNGHDGDDWSNNNVRTGGAGAIGWRVARTNEIANELLAIEEALKEVKE